MKKWFALVALLLFVGLAPQIEAQQSRGQSSLQQYTVQKGDTLWRLSGKYLGSALLWEQIYQANPFLRGRRYQDNNGETIVILKPGEVLNGLTPLGIQAVEDAPLLSTLKGETVEITSEKIPSWMWFFFLALSILTLYIFSLWRKNVSELYAEKDKHEKTKDIAYDRGVKVDNLGTNLKLLEDPVTSGPAFVPEGVTTATAGQHFQNMAARQWERETNRGPIAPSMIRIREIVSGHGWGRMVISYSNGRNEERILTGQRLYRGIATFPDNKEETLYMLQGCGNDVRYLGNRNDPSQDFRFVPDSEAIQTTPVNSNQDQAGGPVVPATDRVEELGREVKRMLSSDVDFNTTRFEFKPEANGRAMMVRVTGIDTSQNELAVDVNEDSIIFRVKQ